MSHRPILAQNSFFDGGPIPTHRRPIRPPPGSRPERSRAIRRAVSPDERTRRRKETTPLALFAFAVDWFRHLTRPGANRHPRATRPSPNPSNPALKSRRTLTLERASVPNHRSHEGPHRGGAGKGGWGKPGDELNAPKEGDEPEPEPEPEEPDNEISIEDFEAAKAAKKAALNAAMAKGATAKGKGGGAAANGRPCRRGIFPRSPRPFRRPSQVLLARARGRRRRGCAPSANGARRVRGR